MKKFRDRIRNGEHLAIKRDADILSLLMADDVVENQVEDGVCVVTVRGPLEHHACGAGDSYDQISERMREAFDCDDAKCIVMRIDSPGGVVSGLNQTVYALRRAKSKPVYVYVDEMACSAAYALACIGDEIYLPSSGIAGSVGVISTICDQVGADQKQGLNFVTITSGARKSDGHPHVPISDGAVKAETARVNNLAKQFFKLVAKARGIDAEPFQAGIFLGKDAVTRGLADGVMGFDSLMSNISLAYRGGVVSPSRVAQSGTVAKRPKVETEMLKIKAMIAKWESELAAGGKPARMLALAGNIEAAKKTYKKMTEEETEETNDHEEEAEEASEESEESEETEGGGNDTDRDEKDPPPPPPSKDKKDDDDDSDSDEEDDEEEESEEEDAKKERKAAATLRKVAASAKGTSRAALLESAKAIETASAKRRAVRGENKLLRRVSKEVAAIKQDRSNDKRDSLVAKLLREGRVTPAEAKKELSKATLATVQTWEKARPRAIVRSMSDKLNADLSVDAQSIGRNLGGAPDSVISEVTQEMRDAAARVTQLSNGKLTEEMQFADYTSKGRRS